MTVSLRPYTLGDRFVLNRWLGEPDVVAWFGSRSAAEAELALAQSSPSSFIRVILFDGAPIGYAQAFDIGLSCFQHPAIPSGSYDADVFIGSTPHRGLGHGAAALRQLTDEVFATTFTVAVAITVPLRNEQAVRRIERAGFTWQAVIHDHLLGPLWILRRDRP
jgi:RimJ/RimL family protein N-acetyltransferase